MCSCSVFCAIDLHIRYILSKMSTEEVLQLVKIDVNCDRCVPIENLSVETYIKLGLELYMEIDDIDMLMKMCDSAIGYFCLITNNSTSTLIENDIKETTKFLNIEAMRLVVKIIDTMFNVKSYFLYSDTPAEMDLNIRN